MRLSYLFPIPIQEIIVFVQESWKEQLFHKNHVLVFIFHSYVMYVMLYVYVMYSYVNFDIWVTDDVKGKKQSIYLILFISYQPHSM